MSATQEFPTTSPIGRSTPRVDGAMKVSGKAQYTSDFHFPETLYAVPVRVTYDKEKPNVETHLEVDNDPDSVVTTFGMRERVDSQRGDADAAFASAPVHLDQTYVTPAETHNPIELHATTAIWEGSKLTLYDSSQGVVNFRSVLAQMFDLPKES